MTNKLIIPKTYIQKIDVPLIFLAGPIRGAPNWQDNAVTILLEKEKNLMIASPRRGIREAIAQYVVNGDDAYFPRQRAWERHYLDLAAKTGAILFWLPGEVEHKCEKAYGAMTRVELGQWMTKSKQDKSVRWCIGSDGKFSELNTLLYDLSLDAPEKEVKKTLEETCAEALLLASASK